MADHSYKRRLTEEEQEELIAQLEAEISAFSLIYSHYEYMLEEKSAFS